ncbi:MAG: hypothetical protein J6W64_01760 [Bacilli bacterium]|nr:hypothetical protein [Bacilli bacterium]
MNNKGFTLIELLGVLVLLIITTLIAIAAVSRATERAKIKAFIKEANTYAKAADNKYLYDKTLNDDDKEDLYNGTKPGKVCYSIKDNLVGKYIEKDEEKIHGSVEVCFGDSCTYQYKLWLTDGTYYINGKTSFDKNNDVDFSSNINYFDSCATESIGSYTGTNAIANFSYKGYMQQMTILKDGTYSFEAWGAQGGNYLTKFGGYGSYTYAEKTLKKGDVLYINVGGQGVNITQTNNSSKGGYNGGSDPALNSAGGGGLTSISLSKRSLNNESYKDELIVVAAGGGGASSTAAGQQAGGNCSQYNNVCQAGIYLGTAANTSSGAGIYGSSNRNNAGGTGYFNASASNGVMYCNSCPDDNNASTKTISVQTVSMKPTANTPKIGDGYAKISLII